MAKCKALTGSAVKGLVDFMSQIYLDVCSLADPGLEFGGSHGERGARTYNKSLGFWGRAVSGVQGQSPWPDCQAELLFVLSQPDCPEICFCRT